MTIPNGLIDARERTALETQENEQSRAFGTGMIDMIDPQRLWQRAIELRVWLIAILAIALTLAVIFTLLQTPQYLATARIEISRVDSGAAEIEEIAIEGEARDRQYYATQYVLLGSRFLADRVVEAENLVQDRAALAALGFAEGSGPNERQVARSLLNHVEVSPLEMSNLVDVSVRSGSAEVSARLANAWAGQFLEANYDKRFGDTVEARRQLDSQLAELRARLENSEAELIQFANANGIVVLQQRSSGDQQAEQTLVENQLAALNQALAEATARRIAAASTASVGTSQSNGQEEIRTRISEVEATLARLRTTLGPQNSQVEAAQAELNSLRAALNEQQSLSGSALQAQLRAAQREEAELQQRFDQARTRYLAQQDQGVEYGILQREVLTNRELYNALLQRYKELGVATSGRNNMTLIEAAEPPVSPYSPKLFTNLLIALAAAAVAGGGLVFVRDVVDDTVRDPSEIRRRLQVPLLGLIPKFEPDDIDRQLADPKSQLSEAYASARVAIDYATATEDKIIIVTSTRPDEGKSLSSLALAYNFTRKGKKVLLVDMDLRRKGISIRLNQSKQAIGMATYLAGETENLPSVRMDKFNLDFIPAGKSTLNPADILATSRTEMVLDELKRHYDYIVLDAPPILGLADTPQLADAADAIVYVVQANASTFRSITQALTRLRATQGKILGVVVTKLDKRNESYSYGYGYGYGYDYDSKGGTALGA
ncbi:GumC family protein [Alteriqipengyuania lutimaris]|uniref:non-specific protein-tyrosine kinase n=1 Tax=Alteriqipengyuania lutimaris TaxID=1538146 RepID=A0A395LJ64_9SPHN|nr:polysaccharide biosynthesis tyrosine autokinase [Alteriqipengyuania lutimaris]MBB3034373.1 capsular exopolysaccharide synthesis family protein [Alteriqipengyuania lutimaris]RDS76725.1 hypothetical protein DL238_03295 [Alteriqipengyuania lutimaris]